MVFKVFVIIRTESPGYEADHTMNVVAQLVVGGAHIHSNTSVTWS